MRFSSMARPLDSWPECHRTEL